MDIQRAQSAVTQQGTATQQGPVITPKPDPECVAAKPLNTWGWDISPNLKIAEATTQRFRATWTVRAQNCHGKWPREYDFKADCNGWVSDHFIQGGCKSGMRVFWNLATGAARVETLDGKPTDPTTARSFASFARRTVFPGIDLNKLS